MHIDHIELFDSDIFIEYACIQRYYFLSIEIIDHSDMISFRPICYRYAQSAIVSTCDNHCTICTHTLLSTNRIDFEWTIAFENC